MNSITLTIDATRIDVDFDYLPSESPSKTSDGRAAEVDLQDVMIDGVSVHNLLVNVAPDWLESLKGKVLLQHEREQEDDQDYFRASLLERKAA